MGETKEYRLFKKSAQDIRLQTYYKIIRGSFGKSLDYSKEGGGISNPDFYELNAPGPPDTKSHNELG